MKYQTLADITDELVQAGRFLNTFTGERLQCIQCFCECQTIVKWIRNRTKGTDYLWLYMRDLLFPHYRCE